MTVRSPFNGLQMAANARQVVAWKKGHILPLLASYLHKKMHSEARSHVRNALQAFQSVAQLSMQNPFPYIFQLKGAADAAKKNAYSYSRTFLGRTFLVFDSHGLDFRGFFGFESEENLLYQS